MTNGFTRQETIAITGVKSGRLSYLDKTGLVTPEKEGNHKHPKVIYNWEKVLQIKIIERLRENLSLQEIRKILDFLQKRGYSPSLFRCKLVFIDKQLYLIENWEKFGNLVLKASGTNKGQIVIHEIGAIGEILSELREEAERNHILDFNKRAKGTPLESALIKKNHALEEEMVSVNPELTATQTLLACLQKQPNQNSIYQSIKMPKIQEADKFSPVKLQPH
ncbi:MAG: MerR family transcriptional regulator [Coleofasciculaceae cyanobacterium]